MSSPTVITDVLLTYGNAIEGLTQKIQTDRSLHEQHLQNAYLEAARVKAPNNVLSMFESVLSNRLMFNQRKTDVDVRELEHHIEKMSAAVQPHAESLLGGGGGALRGGARSDLLGGASRTDRLVAALHTKLIQERSVNFQELQNVQQEMVRVLGEDAPFSRMMTKMLSDQEVFNARKDLHDAQQMSQLNLVATEMLGGDAVHVVKHGVQFSNSDLLSGGGPGPLTMKLIQTAARVV